MRESDVSLEIEIVQHWFGQLGRKGLLKIWPISISLKKTISTKTLRYIFLFRIFLSSRWNVLRPVCILNFLSWKPRNGKMFRLTLAKKYFQLWKKLTCKGQCTACHSSLVLRRITRCTFHLGHMKPKVHRKGRSVGRIR